MTTLAEPAARDSRPPYTNRGVYPHEGWSLPAFDYYRATVPCLPEELLSALPVAFDRPGMPCAWDEGGPVANYDEHRILRDRLGREKCALFWGGRNSKPNVQSKGANAVVVAALLRGQFEHYPSRADTKRDARLAGLFTALVDLALAYADRFDLAVRYIDNKHPDKGNTLYLGSTASQAYLRIYQPGLKRAQAEGRTGDAITVEEREAVRVELQFQPQKRRAKLLAATLEPDQMFGVSQWIAQFASEVFGMNVQTVSISERRESDRNRALRYMTSQYRAHLASLAQECGHDPTLFGSIIMDLADIHHRH